MIQCMNSKRNVRKLKQQMLMHVPIYVRLVILKNYLVKHVPLIINKLKVNVVLTEQMYVDGLKKMESKSA